MRKIAIATAALAMLFVSAPVQAASPQDPCTENCATGLEQCEATVTTQQEQIADLTADVAHEKAENAALQTRYGWLHQRWEIRGGRIEGLKDQVRWDRAEIKRLREKLHAAQD